jgi:dipicolinate synthase subunit A
MLGGDLRQLAVAERLAERYDNINLWGLSAAAIKDVGGVREVQEVSEAIEGADILLLPLPASVDGVTLNSPLADTSERVRMSRIAEMARDGAIVIGGKIPEAFARTAEKRGLTVKDYFESEDFQIKNAYTTAEAALSIAMNALDRNIRGARVAITGYGRIAKHLATLLMAIGARVTVAARRESDVSFAESLGCESKRITEGASWWSDLTGGYDVIYNTVPTWIFGRDFLSAVDKKTLIVDLASAPGGVDIRAARELGSNVSLATSLPGKYAPRSAGEIIASCVLRIIEEVLA